MSQVPAPSQIAPHLSRVPTSRGAAGQKCWVPSTLGPQHPIKSQSPGQSHGVPSPAPHAMAEQTEPLRRVCRVLGNGGWGWLSWPPRLGAGGSHEEGLWEGTPEPGRLRQGLGGTSQSSPRPPSPCLPDSAWRGSAPEGMSRGQGWQGPGNQDTGARCWGAPPASAPLFLAEEQGRRSDSFESGGAPHLASPAAGSRRAGTEPGPHTPPVRSSLPTPRGPGSGTPPPLRLPAACPLPLLGGPIPGTGSRAPQSPGSPSEGPTLVPAVRGTGPTWTGLGRTFLQPHADPLPSPSVFVEHAASAQQACGSGRSLCDPGHTFVLQSPSVLQNLAPFWPGLARGHPPTPEAQSWRTVPPWASSSGPCLAHMAAGTQLA